MKENDAIQILLSARVMLYSVCARGYREPLDEEFGKTISGTTVFEACSLLGVNSELQYTYEQIIKCFNDKEIEQHKADYTRLFLGPTIAVPPWESVYVTKERVLFQASTLHVRECYRKQGFIASGYPSEADDHIAIEFDFMAKLATRMLQAFEDENSDVFEETLKASMDFLEDHLGMWIKGFQKAFEERAFQDSLYWRLTQFAVEFLQNDEVLLRELMQERCRLFS